MRRIRKSVMCLLFVILILSSTILTPLSVMAASTTEELTFEETNVLNDLMQSTTNGKPFSITDYPFDNTKDIQVINFVEYCYTTRAEYKDKYGLYIYIYNPKGLDLSKSENFNKIQMAVSYDGEGKPNDYEKFSLKLCSKVESGDFKNLFYKFKVVDKQVNGTTFIDRVNSNGRKYHVSGIELATNGSNNATEYPVSSTYLFTGYAEGCGPDATAKSTLNCEIEGLETVSLNVKHTFYRTQTSSLGAGHQNQLDTVYFSVPKRLMDDYGTLQRIKAEWWEYKTKEILVTSNSDFANGIEKYIGDFPDITENFLGVEYYERFDTDYGLLVNWSTQEANVSEWGWNVGGIFTCIESCPTLYYLFEVENIGEFDPYADITESGGVQSNELYDYIKKYNSSYRNGTLPIKDGNISADLFESDIDESRKMDNAAGKIQKGYSYYDFDADVDLQELNSWSSTNPNFWDNWKNFGFGAALSGGPDEESREVAPIYILKAEDLLGKDEDIADRLMVQVSDVDDIKAEYNDAIKVNAVGDEEKVVVLFRFATSDYYSEKATIFIKDGGILWADKYVNDEAYIAQESVFFDFDIIQLTFLKDGVYTVIPVVSSPIDIVNAITPPANNREDDWWKILLAILLLILIIYILWPVLPMVIKVIAAIFKWIIKIIVFPFKAIGKLFKKKRDKPKEQEEIKLLEAPKEQKNE